MADNSVLHHQSMEALAHIGERMQEVKHAPALQNSLHCSPQGIGNPVYTQLHSLHPSLITVIPQLTKWSSHCRQGPLHRNGGTDCSTVCVVSPITPPISHPPHLSPATHHTSHLPPTYHTTHLHPPHLPSPTHHTTDLVTMETNVPLGTLAIHPLGTFNFGRHPQCSLW